LNIKMRGIIGWFGHVQMNVPEEQQGTWLRGAVRTWSVSK